MLIFFISPHPDDIEYGCGGIIKKSCDAGHCVHCFVNKYSANKNDEFFNQTRLKEAMTVENLGCKVHFWNNNKVNKMIEWICDETFSTFEFMPDIIIDVTSEYTTALKQLKLHQLGTQTLPALPYVFQINHQNRGIQGSCLYGEGLIINKNGNCLWVHNTRKLFQYLISINQKGVDDE